MLRPLILLALVQAASMSDPAVASAAPVTAPRAAPPRPSGEECFSAYEGAQSSRRSGRLVRSKSELAVCISVCPAALQNDCKGWLADVEANIPRLSIVARGASGEELRSFEVDVDGVGWSTPAELELDPGPHVVRVSAAGHLPTERSVVLSAANHTRETFSLALDPQASATTSPAEARSSVGPWVLGGTGAAMLLAAGTLSLVGWIDFDDMKHSCAPGCSNDRIDDVRTKWLAGGILAGTGALAVGGAVLWRLFGDRSELARSVRVGPGGVQFSRSF